MNFKSGKIIFISIIILSCLVTISCVAAQNNTDTDLISTSPLADTVDVTANSNNNLYGNGSNSLETFLSDIENANSGDTVYLNEDIVINDTIKIDKELTIDGQNHIIDGNNLYRIMNPTAKITLKNIIFKNGAKTDSSGGSIYTYYDLTIDNCQFINNKAYNGGAIDCHGNTLTITNSKFIQNSAKDSGGAILAHYTHVFVTNCNFEKNTAIATSWGTRGGAICAFDSARITSSTFTDNQCKAVSSGKTPSRTQQSLGGALYLLSGTQQIIGCTFNSNSVDNDGGAIFTYCDVSRLTVTNSVFTNNNAYYEDGGAISSSAHNIDITGSTFSGNYAYEDGGAIDTYSFDKKTVKVTIDKCTFTANKGYKSAGAIYMGIKTKYVVKNSNFKNNKGTVAGCLFVEPTCSGSVYKCNFNQNSACNVARKVIYSKSKSVVKHSGGAIYTKSKSLSISNCNFNSNTATYGGAICNHGKVTVKSCKFTKNSAESGGAYFHDKGTSSLKSNTFTSNKAKNAGGAVYFKKGKMSTSKNKFSKNNAKAGGVIFVKSKTFSASKDKYSSNKAKFGGAIFNQGKATFKSCKFIKNTAKDSGGAYFQDKGTTTIKKNAFSSNKASKAGGAIYLKKGKIKSSKNKFSKNKAKFGKKYYSKKSVKI